MRRGRFIKSHITQPNLNSFVRLIDSLPITIDRNGINTLLGGGETIYTEKGNGVIIRKGKTLTIIIEERNKETFIVHSLSVLVLLMPFEYRLNVVRTNENLSFAVALRS